MKGRDVGLRFSSAVGAVIGYGCLLLFLYLVGMQTTVGSAKENGRTSA
jgi:hypothetical protein